MLIWKWILNAKKFSKIYIVSKIMTKKNFLNDYNFTFDFKNIWSRFLGEYLYEYLQEAHVYKYADRSQLYYQCQISISIKVSFQKKKQIFYFNFYILINYGYFSHFSLYALAYKSRINHTVVKHFYLML